MPSQKEKFERDAQRAKDRNFVGYLLDRSLARNDFEKEAPPRPAMAVPTGPIGSENPANDEARKAAGMKKGGRVRATGYRGYGASRKV